MAERADNGSFPLEIFAATSSGCEKLARSIGLPVACLRVSQDADAAVAAMNAADCGGWTLWADGFQPFEPEAGWRDWRVLPFGSGEHISHDVRYANGRFVVDLSSHVTAGELATALRAEFRRFAVAEVTTSPRWLVAQCEALQPMLVMPRYTLRDGGDFRAGVERLDDLYVMDPRIHVALIARAISKARARAVRHADEALLHV